MRWAVLGIAVMMAGCGGAPAESPPPPAAEEAPASVAGQTVVGTVPKSASGAVPIVVLEPRPPRDYPPGEPTVMDQFGLEFLPRLLLARTGQTVRFRNSEDVLHNVRVTESETKAPEFNVATPPYGTYEHVFERPGFYVVTCDVHPAMRADILIASSPYAIVAERDGSFTLTDVPPGSYDLTVFLGADRIQRVVEVTDSPTELRLGSE